MALLLTTAATSTLATAASPPEDLHEALQALPDDASEAMQAEVVTRHADLDGSGHIDTDREVLAISCGALRELDARARRRWGGASIRVAYGIDTNLIWGGGKLGFHDAVRRALSARLTTCGLPPLPKPTGAPPRSGDPAADLRARATAPTPSLSAMRAVLLDAFDHDDSGWLDRRAEVRALGCDVWAALDDALTTEDEPRLRDRLGLPKGRIHRGEDIGLSVRVRAASDRAAARCGLDAAPPANAANPSAREALAAFQDGATLERIAASLRTAATGSPQGTLDRGRHLRRLDCTHWHLLEAAARDEGGEPWLRLRMGLPGGLPFDGTLLKLDPSLRRRADRFASRCGLQPDPKRAALSPVQRALQLHGELTWDERIGDVVTDAYGGGHRLNTPEQVKSIPCEVWLALNAHVHRSWGGNGLRVIYGLSRDYLWVGGVLGLDESVRDAADAAAVQCGLR